MKIIDGQDAVLGRLASYAAKEALNGETVIIVNCEQIIISGNKKDIEEDFRAKKSKIGSGQQGPKYSMTSEKIVKRAVRGMLPNHRRGRGKEAFKRVRCYVGIPKEFQETKKIVVGKESKIKSIKVKDILR